MTTPDNKRSVKAEFEFRLIRHMYGRLQLLDADEKRRMVVEEAVAEILKNDAPGEFAEVGKELEHGEAREAFITEFLGYGPVSGLLQDLDVEDIIINGLQPIYIHHGKKGLCCVEKSFENADALELFIEKLILFSGRTDRAKIMNIELPNLQGRVNLVESPFGPQLTITKAKMSPISIIDLVKGGSMSYEVAAQLWLYIEGMSFRPANMIIAGGPGVGKTTLLNALFSFVPEGDRIVVIEDTLELNTEFEESCSRLESGDDYSLADLVKNSLRMRPERIVIGEVRGEEARDMMTAVNVGKYCIGTIHALTSREAIIRLQNEPMNIPEELIRLIDAFVVLKRYHVENKLFRVVDEVSETSGMEQEKVLLSHIYKYDYEKNAFKGMATSTIYRDRLAREAGLLPKDIILEVQMRAVVLEKLAELGHTTLREITSFCRDYNRDPDKAVAKIGLSRDEILGAEYMQDRRRRTSK